MWAIPWWWCKKKQQQQQKMQQKQTTCNAAIQWRWFNERNKWNLYTKRIDVRKRERENEWIKIDGR